MGEQETDTLLGLRMTLYEILGVTAAASAEEVKAAYRRRARETHPDCGGCREEFQRVQHAYEILGDPQRRARYDDCGDEGQAAGVPPPEQILMSAFAAALDEVRGTNPVEYLKMLLEERLKNERQNLQKHEREIARWQKIRTRLERLTGEAILEGVIEARIRPHQHGAAMARGWIDGLRVALGLADGYRYRDAAEDQTIGDLLEGLQGQRMHYRKRRAA